MAKRTPVEYALYKGDKFIMIGTIKEITNRLGIKQASVEFYKSPAYLKRNPKGYMLFRIED